MAQVRSQFLSRAAYERVLARQAAGSAKYLAMARSFPTLVHNCGLSQACAFALAKGAERLDVLSDVAVVASAGLPALANGDPAQALHDRATTCECDEYMRLTRTCLEAATWIKRYSEAVLAGNPAVNCAAAAADGG